MFILALCLLCNFSFVLSSFDIFQNHLLLKNIFQECHQRVTRLDRDQAQQDPDLIRAVCKGYQPTAQVNKELE